MDYQDGSENMDGWKMVRVQERPDPVGREPAMAKEVTPCSEYTRFTSEGRMMDPHSSLSVILDSYLTGHLFRSGPFQKAKWSDRLGYGMGLIGEDTRIHLHTTGKYVIRRALDRDHANFIQLVLSQLSRPALYSTRNGSFMWEIIRDLSLGKDVGDLKSIDQLFPWPGGEGCENDMEEAIASFNEADELFSSTVERILEDGSDLELENISNGSSQLVDEFGNGSQKLLDGDLYLTGKVLGWGSYILLVLTAIKNR